MKSVFLGGGLSPQTDNGDNFSACVHLVVEKFYQRSPERSKSAENKVAPRGRAKRMASRGDGGREYSRGKEYGDSKKKKQEGGRKNHLFISTVAGDGGGVGGGIWHGASHRLNSSAPITSASPIKYL